MKSNMGIAIAVALFAVVAPRPSLADRVVNDCRFYSRELRGNPEDIAEILKEAPGTEVRACTSPAGPTRYDVFSPTWNGSFGACYMRSQELYRRQNNEGHLEWSYTKEPRGGTSIGYVSPQVYMAIADGKCPAQSSVRYLPVEGVSEGVFLGITSFWDHISRDAKAFDIAFSGLSKAKKSSEAFDRFKKAALTPKNGDALSVAGITYTGPLPDKGLGVPSIRRFSNYVVRINNPHTPYDAYEIEVDLGNHGFEILDFRTIVI